MTATSYNAITGLSRLAEILFHGAAPAPREISECVIVDTDTEGTEALDLIGHHLDNHGFGYRVNDTDCTREIIIHLAENFNYRIFYVYRDAMADHYARHSYCDNITPASTGDRS